MPSIICSAVCTRYASGSAPYKYTTLQRIKKCPPSYQGVFKFVSLIKSTAVTAYLFRLLYYNSCNVKRKKAPQSLRASLSFFVLTALKQKKPAAACFRRRSKLLLTLKRRRAFGRPLRLTAPLYAFSTALQQESIKKNSRVLGSFDKCTFKKKKAGSYLLSR